MGFLVRLRESAKAGDVAVLKASADHDRAEIRRRGGRIDTRVRLLSAQARMQASFRLPLSALDGRESLLFVGRDGAAARLLLAEDYESPDQAVDVVAHLAADDRFLREWLAPELRREGLACQADWPELDRAWRLTHAVRARRDGLWCDLRIDLDAR